MVAIGMAGVDVPCSSFPSGGLTPSRVAWTAYMAAPRKEDCPVVTYHHFSPRLKSREGKKALSREEQSAV